jgi:hypothetical protein
MTHDILQSDIELAMRLRAGHLPEGEIIQTLVQRGIDPAKAAQLLEDLSQGRPVNATVPSEFNPRRRSRSQRPRSEQPEPAPTAAVEAPTTRGGHGHSSSRHTKKPPALRQVLIPLICLAVVAVGVGLYLRYRQPSLEHEPAAPNSTGTGTIAKASAGLAAKAPVLELRPDGLHIGERMVRREDPLPAVVAALGTCSRTNKLGDDGATVYAYDQLGLLLYVQPKGRTNSIMLDCDATGGANGTTSAFAGTLKVDGQLIGANTDAQTLAACKPLGLSSVRSDGSIWSGRYRGLSLVFAYLKSPRHLSLIEIDLE